MKLALSPETLLRSAVNAYDMYLGPGLADLTPMASSILAEAPQRTLRRYRPTRRVRSDRPAVLLVPPLAAPANCFDLRRGCSMAEHFVGMGYPTYLVDYGPIHYEDRELGLEHWTDEVIPEAIKQVSRDTGGAPGPAGRLVPRRHHDPARRGRRPRAARGLGGHGGQPLRLHPGPDDGPGPPAGQAHRRRSGHRPLPHARRRTRAARERRASA